MNHLEMALLLLGLSCGFGLIDLQISRTNKILEEINTELGNLSAVLDRSDDETY